MHFINSSIIIFIIMKNTKQLFIIAFAIFFSIYSVSYAQKEKTKSKFILAVGINATAHRTGTSLKEAVQPGLWNIIQSTSSISVGYNVGYGVSIHGTLNFNNIGEEDVEKQFLLNTGLKADYSLGQFIDKDSWFDPYISLGGAYVSLDEHSAASIFLGGGINFWISDVFGIKIQSDYNHALPRSKKINDESVDFYQHNISVVFRL